MSAPNLSAPSATLAPTLPRPRSSNTCSVPHRSMTAVLLPTGGRVRDWPRVEPRDDPTAEPRFDPDDLCPDPADAVVYTEITQIHEQLRELGELRRQHRFNRWAITDLWIVAIGALVIGIAARWWLLLPAAFTFALYAVSLADQVDITAERGRELDEDIAALIDQRRKLMRGGGR